MWKLHAGFNVATWSRLAARLVLFQVEKFDLLQARNWPHTMLGGHSMPLTRGSTGFAGQQLCMHHLPARPALHMGRPGRLVVQARTVEPTVGMWGTKQGMDQFFTTEGECYAATIINFAPGNIVTQASPSSAKLQSGRPASSGS